MLEIHACFISSRSCLGGANLDLAPFRLTHSMHLHCTTYLTFRIPIIQYFYINTILLSPDTETQVMYKLLMSHVKKGQKTSKPSDTQNRWFGLPREIRDEIYRYVLCKTYLIHWPRRWKRGKAVFNEYRPLFWFRGQQIYWIGLFWSGHIWMKKRPLFWADIALLLTSKAISLEAIDIMYKESSFCLYMPRQHCERWDHMTPLPAQQLMDRMRKLEMRLCMCEMLDYIASESWFKIFNCSRAKRSTCHISFPCFYCLDWYEDHAPFFRACQSLAGFKTVTVTLKLRSVYTDSEEALSKRYNSRRDNFKTALEPHLGPGRSHDIENKISLEFHPRKHFEDVQSALSTSGRQALVLEENSESGATAW